MENLSVYEDYTQTMAFLRAGRNRIINTIETSNIAEDTGAMCVGLCNALYTFHVEHGLETLRQLHGAIRSRLVGETTKAANNLHRHNRQTARLSRLFESDVADYHPDPDADYDSTVPAKPANPAQPVTAKKFLAKLHRMKDDIETGTKRTLQVIL
jgi:hypothetical protein